MQRDGQLTSTHEQGHEHPRETPVFDQQWSNNKRSIPGMEVSSLPNIVDRMPDLINISTSKLTGIPRVER